MTKSTRRSSKTKPQRRAWWRYALIALGAAVIFGGTATVVALWVWSVSLEKDVRAKFEGKKWSLPARVYARPLELYEGRSLVPALLDDQLKALGYRNTPGVDAPGQFAKTSKNPQQASYQVYNRGFEFWDSAEPAQKFNLTISGGKVQSLTDAAGASLAVLRLEPEEIGGIYPTEMEDRLLVKLDAIPPILGEALLAMEDKAFLEHHGVSPVAIARAIWVNLTSGQVVQGGSTLTQQLVKNFYLTNERSLQRKVREALMALLLEKNYTKSEIFETYINEVYLGQSGAREIHGFALAAKHYFRQPLNELDTAQIALLVGLVKGASYFNPWKHPERALERRNLVLKVMAQEGLITATQLAAAEASGLNVLPPSGNSIQAYPAFVDLVKRQLQEDYQIEDLRSEGLRVFTTLSGVIQRQAEASVAAKIPQLEKRFKQDLQTAMVVTTVGTAEVLALIGDQKVRNEGFNRALDSRRSIGSLVKPFVYLTALERPEQYHLGTILSDTPATFTLANGQTWSPKNSHDQSHGDVPLYQALAHSYNQATAQLGMTIGLMPIINTLKAAGLRDDILPVPSLLLGAVDMPPIQVAELYHTLAADGVHAPLRVINEVLNSDGKPLRRYPLKIEQKFSPEAIFALQYAMHMVFKEGTARSVLGQFPGDLKLAGKTGTTNDQRDSWFAGFSSELMAVAWVGRDDNQPTPVSGASGALQVWADFMRLVPSAGLETQAPTGMQFVWLDAATGLQGQRGCPGVYWLPLRIEQISMDVLPCSPTSTFGLPPGFTDPAADPNRHAPDRTPDRAPGREREPNLWQRIFN